MGMGWKKQQLPTPHLMHDSSLVNIPKGKAYLIQADYHEIV